MRKNRTIETRKCDTVGLMPHRPTSRKPLAPRQAEVLEAIKTFIRTNHYPPSGPQLSELTGVGIGSINKHVLVLEVKGYITRGNDGRRSIIVIDESGHADKELYERDALDI